MSEACAPFPDRNPVPVVVYAADVVLVPVLFGLGLFGGLLSLVVLHRASLRKESAVYVYLAGLTVLDIVSLLTVVPQTIQVIDSMGVRQERQKQRGSESERQILRRPQRERKRTVTSIERNRE